MKDEPPGHSSPLYGRPSVVSSCPAFAGTYIRAFPLALIVPSRLIVERIASLIAHGIPFITIQAGILFPRHFLVFGHTVTHDLKFSLVPHDYYV